MITVKLFLILFAIKIALFAVTFKFVKQTFERFQKKPKNSNEGEEHV